MLRAWLVGRSLARGLPTPVEDRGGLRVDTGSEAEERRWLFATVCDGLIEVSREINTPRNPLKLCGPMAELLAVLPAGWVAQPAATFMRARGGWRDRPLPRGYALEIWRYGAVAAVRIRDDQGARAAGGFAAETSGAFVYDRIETAREHRRRGLGHAVMSALRLMKEGDVPELLTATPDGQALYETLGWEVLSPYSTAAIPEIASP